MRLVSPTGELLAWEDDPDGYQKNARRLGLDQNAVLEAFGEFTQLNYMTGTITPQQLHAHLYARFPAMVTRPDIGQGERAA